MGTGGGADPPGRDRRPGLPDARLAHRVVEEDAPARPTHRPPPAGPDPNSLVLLARLFATLPRRAGAGDWVNARRTFKGAKIFIRTERWDFDLLAFNRASRREPGSSTVRTANAPTPRPRVVRQFAEHSDSLCGRRNRFEAPAVFFQRVRLHFPGVDAQSPATASRQGQASIPVSTHCERVEAQRNRIGGSREDFAGIGPASES